jgi:hypothetical protein
MKRKNVIYGARINSKKNRNHNCMHIQTDIKAGYGTIDTEYGIPTEVRWVDGKPIIKMS